MSFDVDGEFDECVGALAVETERGDDALEGFETRRGGTDAYGVRRSRSDEE